MILNAAVVLTLALLAGGCDSSEPAGPVPDPPDAERGRVAFTTACASCHASRDGYDLALFDFPAADIIRRAVAHVDSATARDIAAYVATLPVASRSRTFRPFQPGGSMASDDAQFWRQLFGTDGWPETLTVYSFATIDLRDVPVPLPFPEWSSEGDESDWMPESPLPDHVLEADGGVLARTIAGYYATPSRSRLLDVVGEFQRVTRTGGPAAVCAGTAAVHEQPVPCFEARRWVSSLTAVHLLREGELREVPFEIAELWWDTGEAAVSVYFRVGGMDRTTVGAWLYMSSVFAPGGFPNPETGIAEDASYMGQMLQSSGRSRLAVVATLRRLAARAEWEPPMQDYWDAHLASIRSTRELRPGVLEAGLSFLLDQQAAGRLPADRELARRLIELDIDDFEAVGGSGDAATDARIRELATQVIEGL